MVLKLCRIIRNNKNTYLSYLVNYFFVELSDSTVNTLLLLLLIVTFVLPLFWMWILHYFVCLITLTSIHVITIVLKKWNCQSRTSFGVRRTHWHVVTSQAGMVIAQADLDDVEIIHPTGILWWLSNYGAICMSSCS